MGAVIVVMLRVIVGLGARLGGNGVGLGANQRRIPGRRHADGLRKDGGEITAPASHAPVETFVAMAVSGNSQAWNSRALAT